MVTQSNKPNFIHVQPQQLLRYIHENPILKVYHDCLLNNLSSNFLERLVNGINLYVVVTVFVGVKVHYKCMAYATLFQDSQSRTRQGFTRVTVPADPQLNCLCHLKLTKCTAFE